MEHLGFKAPFYQNSQTPKNKLIKKLNFLTFNLVGWGKMIVGIGWSLHILGVDRDQYLLVLVSLSYICRSFFLTQFYINFLGAGTSDRTQIGLDQLLKCLGFSLYPFHFTLTIALKNCFFLEFCPLNVEQINIFFYYCTTLRRFIDLIIFQSCGPV